MNDLKRSMRKERNAAGKQQPAPSRATAPLAQKAIVDAPSCPTDASDPDHVSEAEEDSQESADDQGSEKEDYQEPADSDDDDLFRENFQQQEKPKKDTQALDAWAGLSTKIRQALSDFEEDVLTTLPDGLSTLLDLNGLVHPCFAVLQQETLGFNVLRGDLKLFLKLLIKEELSMESVYSVCSLEGTLSVVTNNNPADASVATPIASSGDLKNHLGESIDIYNRMTMKGKLSFGKWKQTILAKYAPRLAGLVSMSNAA